MIFPRLMVIAALLAFAVPALSQQQAKDAPQQPAQAGQSVKTDGDNSKTRQFTIMTLEADADREMVLAPWDMDGACFTIHSIQVARDSKDSDATHFVRSSTCQPASRYRLRTAQETDSTNTKK